MCFWQKMSVKLLNCKNIYCSNGYLLMPLIPNLVWRLSNTEKYMHKVDPVISNGCWDENMVVYFSELNCSDDVSVCIKKNNYLLIP